MHCAILNSQNGLEQGDAFHPLLFTFDLQYNFRKVEKYKKNWRAELHGVHQFLVYDDAVNVLGENTDTTERNKEALLFTSKEVSLEVNREYKHMLMSCHQTAGQNHNIKTANICTSFENELMFKTVTNHNCILEEITTRLNSGTACNYSIQNIFSSHLLSKDIDITTYKKLIYLLFHMGVRPGVSH
jgi:hypothetical protein